MEPLAGEQMAIEKQQGDLHGDLAQSIQAVINDLELKLVVNRSENEVRKRTHRTLSMVAICESVGSVSITTSTCLPNPFTIAMVLKSVR